MHGDHILYATFHKPLLTAHRTVALIAVVPGYGITEKIYYCKLTSKWHACQSKIRQIILQVLQYIKKDNRGKIHSFLTENGQIVQLVGGPLFFRPTTTITHMFKIHIFCDAFPFIITIHICN